MLKTLAVSAALLFLDSAVSAYADPMAYTLSGTLTHGPVSGTVLYDPTTGIISGGTITASSSLSPSEVPFTFTTGGVDTATFQASPLAHGYEETFLLNLGGDFDAPTVLTTSKEYDHYYNSVESTFTVVSATLTAPPVAATPEPSGLVLLGTGILGVVGAARRRLFRA